MSLKARYVLTTSLYAACAIAGAVFLICSIVAKQWVLALIFVAFTLVALDNVFCGDHCRIAGYSAKGHYVVPPFLKR